MAVSNRKTRIKKVEPSDIPGVQGTIWVGFQAVTEFMTHNSGRTLENEYKDQAARLDRLWFGQSGKVVEKARKEALALV